MSTLKLTAALITLGILTYSILSINARCTSTCPKWDELCPGRDQDDTAAPGVVTTDILVPLRYENHPVKNPNKEALVTEGTCFMLSTAKSDMHEDEMLRNHSAVDASTTVKQTFGVHVKNETRFANDATDKEAITQRVNVQSIVNNNVSADVYHKRFKRLTDKLANTVHLRKHRNATKKQINCHHRHHTHTRHKPLSHGFPRDRSSNVV